MTSSSLTVARVMKSLDRALAALEKSPTVEGTLRSRAEALLRYTGVRVALLVANNSGRYVDVNERAPLLTGYSRTELLRMSVWDLTPGAHAVEGRRLWREFQQIGRMAGRYPLCRKDGSLVRADYRAWANVLPGLHVSALATPALMRANPLPARRSKR